MQVNKDQFIWVEKYRPKKVSECILPEGVKKAFEGFLSTRDSPNLILTGGAGVGKTTAVMAMCDELDMEWIKINASLERNVDKLKGDAQAFASTMSLSGAPRGIIFDEADYLNPNSTQPALRGFMEDFAGNCRFYMTCNFLNRIIEPLHSRATIIHFKFEKKEVPGLMAQFMRRCQNVLAAEGIHQYDKAALAEVIKRYFPDMRRILNELQSYAQSGTIDAGILKVIGDESMTRLVGYLKEGDFTGMRKWVVENLDADDTLLYRRLYDMAYSILEPQSIPELVVLIRDSQYKGTFIADKEINLVAFLAECMVTLKFR